MEIIKGMDARTQVLRYALLIENFTSVFLAQLLNIENYRESKSLGNKSGNLSFNQKIDLLIDINALERKDKKKFQAFMSIRNQFMRNLEADSFQNCMKNLDGTENFLLKQFPQPSELNKEEQLENVTTDLANDVIKISVNLIEKVKDKIGTELRNEGLKTYKDNSIHAISEIENLLNDIYNELVKDGKETVAVSELKKLGPEIRSLFYKIVINKTAK